MVTFKVDDVTSVEPSLYRDNKDIFLKQGLKNAKIKGETVEAFAFNTTEKTAYHNPSMNSFVETAMLAFSGHSPVTFAPDEVWLLVCQAVTKHIELFPDSAKTALGVTWEGQKELLVEAHEFTKGSPNNNWASKFNEFGKQIETHLGKKKELFDPTFSTTTPIEKGAIQVQMMAALAPFFSYSMMTCCGVPHITLLGTTEDWADILARVNTFGEFYPKWALEPLQEVLAQFVRASAGKEDKSFWQNFFKRSYGSGSTTINGAITAFFPYVKGGKQNRLMEGNFFENIKKGPHSGYDASNFGGSVAAVPLKWDYYGTIYKMTLATGIFGTTIKEGSYKSVVGWVVGEEGGDRDKYISGHDEEE